MSKVTPLAASPVPSTPLHAPATLPNPGAIRDAAHEILDDIFGGEDGVYDESDKDRLLGQLADTINGAIDVPLIGEKIEKAILLILLKVVMRLGEKYGRPYVESLINKIA